MELDIDSDYADSILEEELGVSTQSHYLWDNIWKLPKEVRNALAGGIAGIVAKSFVAPFDRIKILYQVSAAEFHLQHLPTVVRNIVTEEGVSALWKGNSATMLRVFPYSGIQFMAYDKCKSYFLNLPDRPNSTMMLTGLESLVSGMIAGTVSVLCTYPLDLTRVQLAVLNKKHNRDGFVSILSQNVRDRGIFGLYRGIAPTLLGIIPYAGIAFALNEQGKRKVRGVCIRVLFRYGEHGFSRRPKQQQQIQHLMRREVTTVERLQCGAGAGLVAQTVTYPIEVTRRRMQTIGIVGVKNDSALSSLGCPSNRPRYKKPPNMIRTIQDLYTEQGMRGFFKGVSMNWIKGPVAFSISFTIFDHIQKLMETPYEQTIRPSYR